MGDPKKARKKYATPSHPWQKGRIEAEKVLTKEYGLKNKREIWKMGSMVKTFISHIKSSAYTEQAKKERQQLLRKLQGLGLIKEEATMDDILSLTVKDIMERRLQTLVFRKGLARSIGQARQFIVHGHIKVGDNKVTEPSYLVKSVEEGHIGFITKSSLSSSDHPERGVAT
ncbi:MAG: 30S ribosomal protein S4 [Nanoarchaeota archaeon]|nr:30S ribosomal protein S4 [Nanoarchaeota archaeon]